MNAALTSLHPLFDHNSRYYALRGDGHEARQMYGYLLSWHVSAKHERNGRSGPVPDPQEQWFPAEGPEHKAPTEPLEVLVFLCPSGGSADRPPEFRGSFEARLVLVSAEADNFVGLPWGVAEREALKLALGSALSEPLTAQALLLGPWMFLRLAEALGAPSPGPLSERIALLCQSLTPRALTDTDLVAQRLAAVPDFKGTIDLTGTALFPWYPAPGCFARFPPHREMLTLAFVVQAAGTDR